MILALTSKVYDPRARCTTPPRRCIQQRLSQIRAWARSTWAEARFPPCESTPIPRSSTAYGLGASRRRRQMLDAQNANLPKGQLSDERRHLRHPRQRPTHQGRRLPRPLIVGYHNGAAIKLYRRRRKSTDSIQNIRSAGYHERRARRACSSSSERRARTSSTPSTASARPFPRSRRRFPREST